DRGRGAPGPAAGHQGGDRPAADPAQGPRRAAARAGRQRPGDRRRAEGL
ncbi:MAG: hypothetical protein AVDCRST_MAG50-3138, partial [uncultured Acidimicrobiales bacterium]